MKKLRRLIVRFIARAVAEDYQANGVTRQIIKSDASGSMNGERGAKDAGLLFKISATKG